MARPRGAKARAEIVRERLALEYPEAICALVHDDAFQLLTATILSAQTTDENVNKVTPALFARYPTPSDLAHANPDDVERLVFQTGFYRSKTKNLLGMARSTSRGCQSTPTSDGCRGGSSSPPRTTR